MNQIKEVLKIFLTRIIGFFIFLVLLGAANLLIDYIKNNIFSSIVAFINANFILIISFSLILMIGEMFEVLVFPFNLPYPLFNSVGWILLLNFIFNVLGIIFSIIDINQSIPLNSVHFITSIFIFAIVLIVGYVKIFANLFKPKKKESAKKDKLNFENIGEELKEAGHNLIKKTKVKVSKKRKLKDNSLLN